MTREMYESLPLKELREIAKARGMKSTTALRKAQLIDRMLEEDEKDARKAQAVSEAAGAAGAGVSAEPAAMAGVSAAPAAGAGVSAEPAAAAVSPAGSAGDAARPAGSQTAAGQTMNLSAMAGFPAGLSTGEDSSAAAGPSEDADYDRPFSVADAAGGDSDAAGEGISPVPGGAGASGDGRDLREAAPAGGAGAADASALAGSSASAGAAPQAPAEQAAAGEARGDRSGRGERPRRQSGSGNGRRNTNTRYETRDRGENQGSRDGGRYVNNGRRQADYDAGSAAEGTFSNENIVPGAEDDSRENLRAVSAQILKTQDGAHGILEVLPDGYGFIRSANFLPGDKDVYVSPSQIRRFNLKTGDYITGATRSKAAGEKFNALIHIDAVNDLAPDEARRRVNFEDMTPVFPNRRLKLEYPGVDTSMRIVDLVSPIGYGQRGMIVSQPKAGKTTLLKQIARSVLKNAPDMHMIILLIDERPEEVTDMKEAIQGDKVEVIYSTFDELPEHHKRVSEMVIERAKRLVEHKEDVIILLDSITRLARAYNLTVPPSGRTLSGGLDPAALHMPKRFFGAARNMREGGSLTILATALVETGSKMDDVVYEEFKGTGNMELVLDRKLSERRVFPAIDIVKSGTRREDLLLTKEESAAVLTMRRSLNGLKAEEASETLLNLFIRTRNNREFCDVLTKRRMSGN